MAELRHIWVQLEKLRIDLRTGVMDSVLLAYFAEIRGNLNNYNADDEPLVRNLLAYLKRYHNITRRPNTRSLRRTRRCFAEIIELLARLGLERQLFAYLSRFPGHRLARTARAYEYLQVVPLDEDLHQILGTGTGIRPTDRLNFFRLAQRLRDEHGIARSNPIPNCFQSLEDIIELEDRIELKNPQEFMHQCLDLTLVDGRHIEKMYKSMWTYSQLDTLHEKILRLIVRSSATLREPAVRSFAERFEELITIQPSLSPIWPELKVYLKLESSTYPGHEIIYCSDIANKVELTELLNCVLNYSRVHFENSSSETTFLVKTLISLGADLQYKEQPQHVSSLEGFLELAEKQIGVFPLRAFHPHICCPLMWAGERIAFDNRTPSDLGCLAARQIPFDTEDERIPVNIRALVCFHQFFRYMLVEHYQRRSLLQQVDGFITALQNMFPFL